MICQRCWGSGVVCHSYDLCQCEVCAGLGNVDCCEGEQSQPEVQKEVVRTPILWHGPQYDRKIDKGEMGK